MGPKRDTQSRDISACMLGTYVGLRVIWSLKFDDVSENLNGWTLFVQILQPQTSRKLVHTMII